MDLSWLSLMAVLFSLLFNQLTETKAVPSSSFFFTISDQFSNSFPPQSLCMYDFFLFTFYVWHILVIFSPFKSIVCDASLIIRKGRLLEGRGELFWGERHCLIRGFTCPWAPGHLILFLWKTQIGLWELCMSDVFLCFEIAVFMMVPSILQAD